MKSVQRDIEFNFRLITAPLSGIPQKRSITLSAISRRAFFAGETASVLACCSVKEFTQKPLELLRARS